MRPSTTARRYAEAAFDVARRDNDVQGWLRDLQMAAETVKQPDIANFFRDPKVGREEKVETVGRTFQAMRPRVVNLVRILAARDRVHLLPSILQEFIALDRAARGILEARVTVARPIDSREQEEVRRRLEQLTGKTVDVRTDVDPTILGGIVVRMGDQLIDASVAGRLQRLRQEMAV
jgi:F-type H+-transporting ATPase subunit delta